MPAGGRCGHLRQRWGYHASVRAAADPGDPGAVGLRLRQVAMITLLVSLAASVTLAQASDAGGPVSPGAASAAIKQPVVGSPSHSYLVVPPENRSENRNLYWLGEALAEAMEQYLTWGGLDVASREDRRGVEREEMGIGPLMVPTIATRLKEAEEMKVDRLVLGSFITREAREGRGKGSQSGASRGAPPGTARDSTTATQREGGTTAAASGTEAAGRTVVVSFHVLDVTGSRRGPEHTVGPISLDDLPSLQRAVGMALLDAESLPRPASAPPAPTGSEAAPAAYEARVKSLLEEDPDKQARYLTRALQADQDYLRARLEMAMLLRDSGRLEEALTTLNARPLRGDPDLAAQAERLAGELHLEAGRPTPAIDALRRSLRWHDEAATHLALARALAARGDFQIASAELELARRLDPDDPEIAEVRALLAAPPKPKAEETPRSGGTNP